MDKKKKLIELINLSREKYLEEYSLYSKRDLKKWRVENIPKILKDLDITFISKNSGNHLIIDNNNIIADLWPSTEKYRIRKDGMYNKYEEGIQYLIEYIIG